MADQNSTKLVVWTARQARRGMRRMSSDVLSMEDLREGMRLNGTVRNVVDFGAFVDIGVKQDGLLHRSQWPRDRALGVGDVVEVTILRVEKERGRIALGWPDV